MDVSDTIIAVSSPPGRSQRALLRLSGPDACALVDLAQAERGCRRHVLALPEGTLPVLALISRAPSTSSLITCRVLARGVSLLPSLII